MKPHHMLVSLQNKDANADIGSPEACAKCHVSYSKMSRVAMAFSCRGREALCRGMIFKQ